MIILTIRTDKPEAEVGLYDDQIQLKYVKWHAHRQLADSIHRNIESLLVSQTKSLQQIEGIVVFAGPGSFTGLRIGVSVATALAYSLKIPIIGKISNDWIKNGIDRLVSGDSAKNVTIEYGAKATITQQRK